MKTMGIKKKDRSREGRKDHKTKNQDKSGTKMYQKGEKSNKQVTAIKKKQQHMKENCWKLQSKLEPKEKKIGGSQEKEGSPRHIWS